MFVNGLLRTIVLPVLTLSQSPDIIPATESSRQRVSWMQDSATRSESL